MVRRIAKAYARITTRSPRRRARSCRPAGADSAWRAHARSPRSRRRAPPGAPPRGAARSSCRAPGASGGRRRDRGFPPRPRPQASSPRPRDRGARPAAPPPPACPAPPRAPPPPPRRPPGRPTSGAAARRGGGGGGPAVVARREPEKEERVEVGGPLALPLPTPKALGLTLELGRRRRPARRDPGVDRVRRGLEPLGVAPLLETRRDDLADDLAGGGIGHDRLETVADLEAQLPVLSEDHEEDAV